MFSHFRDIYFILNQGFSIFVSPLKLINVPSPHIPFKTIFHSINISVTQRYHSSDLLCRACGYYFNLMEDLDIKGEEQWVADSDEKAEASETISLLEPQKEELDLQDSDDEKSPAKEQQIPKTLPVMGEQSSQRGGFTETICLDDSNIQLIVFIGRKMQLEGRILATNYAISFLINNKSHEEEAYFQIPIGYILRCERNVEDRTCSTIEFTLKYGCSFKIRYGETKGDFSLRTSKILSKLIETSPQFPFEYGQYVEKHLKLSSNIEFPITADAHVYENEGWKKYTNYPEKFKVPLPYLSKTNPQERLVVLSFVFNSGKEDITVWRTGPGRSDPSEDEWVSKSKQSTKLFTIDIKNKGIGTSKSFALRAVQLEGLTFLKDSFSNIFRIAYHNHESLKWLANFNQTRWLDQISMLLQQASFLVNKILNEPAQIIILADTQLRGAQLAALTQILLLPECRTVKGFNKLMERELLQWGCKSYRKQGDIERGTGIIQFLDAVFQLTVIYPLSFQFSQTYLVFIAQSVYSNKFGNFLLATRGIKQQQREQLTKTCCIWAAVDEWLKDPEVACNYLNPFYVDFKQCDIYELKQYPSAKNLQIWNGFFFKKFREKNPDYHIVKRYQQLFVSHFHNKRKTQELRKELSEQHKILVERRTLLKDLKALEF